MNIDLKNTEAVDATEPRPTRTHHARVLRGLGAIALGCVLVGLTACGGDDESGEGGGGGGGDLQSEIVGILTSDEGGSLPEDQAACVARKVIASGVDQADIDEAKASEDGLAVNSKIFDAFNEATMICVPGASQSSVPDGF